jgi:hypothetical protein
MMLLKAVDAGLKQDVDLCLNVGVAARRAGMCVCVFVCVCLCVCVFRV